MGKKRIVTQKGMKGDAGRRRRILDRGSRKKIAEGTLNVFATYNNTLVSLADKKGNVVISSSSGALGFKGAKKGTPYAAAKVGEVLGEKAQLMGLKEVSVVVRGAGPGRESAVRSFVSFGFDLTAIEDQTPVPHNGPRPPKARRV